jgi:hypothetical protein
MKYIPLLRRVQRRARTPQHGTKPQRDTSDATMVLTAHVAGARRHHIGDEIWHGSLAEAIEAEAGKIAESVAASGERGRRDMLEMTVATMTSALVTGRRTASSTCW